MRRDVNRALRGRRRVPSSGEVQHHDAARRDLRQGVQLQRAPENATSGELLQVLPARAGPRGALLACCPKGGVTSVDVSRALIQQLPADALSQQACLLDDVAVRVRRLEALCVQAPPQCGGCHQGVPQAAAVWLHLPDFEVAELFHGTCLYGAGVPDRAPYAVAEGPGGTSAALPDLHLRGTRCVYLTRQPQPHSAGAPDLGAAHSPRASSATGPLLGPHAGRPCLLAASLKNTEVRSYGL